MENRKNLTTSKKVLKSCLILPIKPNSLIINELPLFSG